MKASDDRPRPSGQRIGPAGWFVLLALWSAPPLWAEPAVVTAEAATQQVRLTGFTRARTALPLAAEVAGKVEKVFADVGDAVPEDGRVACLDSTFVELDLEANRAELGRLQAEIDFFQKEVQRYRTLVQQQSSAQVHLDEAERSLSSFRAQRQAARVQGRTLAERRRRHCLTAPPGWLVMERHIEPGQWVNVAEPVAKLGDFSRLLVPFALSMPEYRALLTHAEGLELRFPDLDRTAPARLARVSPGFDEQSRKIGLELEVGKELEPRRGGLRAQLDLTLPTPSGAVVVPAAALKERYEEFWLQRPDGKEVAVVYLGREEPESTAGPALARVFSPDVHPGDRFRVRTQ